MIHHSNWQRKRSMYFMSLEVEILSAYIRRVWMYFQEEKVTQLLIGLYLTALCGADDDGWRHTVYSDSCADSGLANVFSITDV